MKQSSWRDLAAGGSPHRRAGSLVAGASLALAALVSQAASFDRQRFDEFVTMRAGDGKHAVYWSCAGERRSFPEGKLVVRVEGLGTDRLVRDADDASVAYQLHREIFFYRDATTGEVLRQLDGVPATPIVMPYQFTTYRLVGADLEVFVEQGSGDRLMRIGPATILPREARAGTMYSMPLFVQRQGAAFAYYDYLVDPAGHHRVTWTRFDDWVRPPATTRRVTHAVCTREDRFEDLPPTLREYIEKEAPRFREPPRDIEEIRSLQKGAPSS
jgi:hypothetical protein